MKNYHIKQTLLCMFLFCCANNLCAQTLTLQLTPTHVTCFGFQDGAVDLSVTGGTAPYTYEWSNDANTEDISDLPAGLYRVVVTDANLVTAEAEVTLTQPEPLRVELTPYVYPNGYHISQYGSCNGNVTSVVDGGVSPYSYLWMPGLQTAASPTNLCADENVLEITDNNGCTIRESAVLKQPDRSDWTQFGNPNTNPGTHFIGTTDAQDLVLKTNSIERMKLKSNGDMTISSLSGTGSRMVTVDADGKLIAYPCFPWSTCGNNLLGNDFFGSLNNIDVVFKASSQEVMRLKNYGKVSIKEFVNQTFGLLYTDNLGDIYKIDFDYLNPTKYLDATGNWSSLPAGSNVWNINGNHIYNSNSGNVGIGISNPSQKFEVAHSTTVNNSGGMVLHNLDGTNKNSEIKFKRNYTDLWAIGCDVTHTGLQDFFIYDNVNNATRFIINGSGNIGIGTISQTEKLQVTDGSLYIQGEGQGVIVDAQNDKRIGFMKYSGKEGGIWRVPNQDFEIGRVTNTLQSPNGFTTDMVIDGNGKVGIATNPPTTSSIYNLFVGGGIATRDVKVTASVNWPDFIFNTDYKPMNIYELEQFIKQNKHLPGIPSAKEIEKNEGYELGDMVQKLLEKTEEQTLYIIEQQKQIDELKLQVKNLERRK